MRTAEYLELLDPSEDHDLARLNMINYILRLTADSISEGLVGYWSFDENNGEVAHDKSGMSNDGAIHGAKWTPGRNGPALKFGAAGSHVDFGNDPTLHATDAFTIEAWINWTGDYSGADTAWAAVLKDSQYFMGGRIRSASPKLSFFLRVWDKDTGRWEPPADSDYIADPNVWYHVVATYGDELLKVYVNGEPKGTGRKRFAPAASEPLIMGRGIEMPFAGMLDEVRIYNRALSADEIARRYRSLMNQK